MAALSEDMIMEIVARLPLKYAIQCLVLNKSLFRLISQRKNALASSSYPDIKSSIFYKYRSNILKRFVPGSCEKSVTLPYDGGPLILDTYNGILLLIDSYGDDPCVFNPITGGIMFVGVPFKLRGATKLAVDLQESSTFHFKLVNVCSGTSYLWKISILAPFSGRPSWLVSSLEFRATCYCCMSKSVYAHGHGCMYWPQCKKPNKIMVLDLAKEEIRTISFPFSESIAPLLFGLSDGSLQSVYELEDHEIAIHLYDEVKDEWVLKHKISNIIPRSRAGFFDGQHLVIIQEYGDDDKYAKRTRGIVYDILNDKWDKICDGDEGFFSFEPPKTIFSFVPTLAKVSDEYLDNVMAKSKFPRHFSSFAVLQHIITQESNAWNKVQEIKAGNPTDYLI